IASGMGGRVFRAVDMTLGRTVVVKVVNVRDDEEDPGASGRFLAAGEKLRGIVLPNVVQVLRTGVDKDWAYIVFEYLEGEDLERATRREKALVPAAAARAILDAALG